MRKLPSWRSSCDWESIWKSFLKARCRCVPLWPKSTVGNNSNSCVSNISGETRISMGGMEQNKLWVQSVEGSSHGGACRECERSQIFLSKSSTSGNILLLQVHQPANSSISSSLREIILDAVLMLRQGGTNQKSWHAAGPVD